MIVIEVIIWFWLLAICHGWFEVPRDIGWSHQHHIPRTSPVKVHWHRRRGVVTGIPWFKVSFFQCCSSALEQVSYPSLQELSISFNINGIFPFKSYSFFGQMPRKGTSLSEQLGWSFHCWWWLLSPRHCCWWVVSNPGLRDLWFSWIITGCPLSMWSPVGFKDVLYYL